MSSHSPKITFSVPEENIKGIESVLTIVGGKIVYGAQEFQDLGPAPLPVLPEWSPIKVYGGYGAPLDVRKAARAGVPVPSTSIPLNAIRTAVSMLPTNSGWHQSRRSPLQ